MMMTTCFVTITEFGSEKSICLLYFAFITMIHFVEELESPEKV